MTPLHIAALDANGHPNLVRLLEGGADVRAKTLGIVANVSDRIVRPDGASFYHSERTDELPVGLGFDKGCTPLHFAARVGNLAAVESLLEHKSKQVKNGAGGTALHLAALAGSAAIVHELLEHTFKIGVVSKLKKSIAFYDVGMTPVFCALESGDLATVDALLEAGADLSTQTKFGCGATFFASRGGNVDVLNRVLERGGVVPDVGVYSNFPLLEAVKVGNVDVVRALLNAGSPTEEGRSQSPLRLATEQNHMANRALLLEFGAVPLEHRSVGAAARANDVTDLNRRISRGEDVSSVMDGMTPLMHAACMNFPAAARVLIQANADLEVSVSNGTALHFGISNQAWEVVEMLVDAGADCSIANQFGNDALLAAVIGSAPKEIVAKMLEQGVDPYSFNKHGNNAIGIIQRDRPTWLPMFADRGEPRSFVPFSAPKQSRVLAQTSESSWKTLHRELWDELVPPSGPCECVQGEVIRCIGRLTDEAYRNGNINFDDGHRFMIDLIETTLCDGTLSEEDEIAVRSHCRALRQYQRINTDGDGSPHYLLNELVVRWCMKNPDLHPYTPAPDATR